MKSYEMGSTSVEKSEKCSTATKIVSAFAVLFFCIAILTTVALVVLILEYEGKESDKSSEVVTTHTDATYSTTATAVNEATTTSPRNRGNYICI